MNKLCIIPARGGSKRFPNKNITKLNDKPLIYHTIESAINSKIFDKIIFTSDSEDILKIVKEKFNGIIEISQRPKELATDTSKVIDTVEYYFNKNESEQIWLLLPTCPLRDENDILEVNKLMTKELDGVLSITEMEFPPTLGLNKSEDNIITAYDKSDPWINGNSRSQDHPTIYRPNGAIYTQWSDKFKNNKNFYKGKVKGYFMDRTKSVDIDTEFDFILAKNLLENK